jgi:hypothetical protein
MGLVSIVGMETVFDTPGRAPSRSLRAFPMSGTPSVPIR